MIEINILLVEDNEQEQQLCLNVTEDFSDDYQCKINVFFCKNVTESNASLSQSVYDGAIIDMRLEDVGNEGNQVIQEIRENFRRIPVSIMTGTPDVVDTSGYPLINTYKKGEAEYRDIIL